MRSGRHGTCRGRPGACWADTGLDLGVLYAGDRPAVCARAGPRGSPPQELEASSRCEEDQAAAHRRGVPGLRPCARGRGRRRYAELAESWPPPQHPRGRRAVRQGSRASEGKHRGTQGSPRAWQAGRRDRPCSAGKRQRTGDPRISASCTTSCSHGTRSSSPSTTEQRRRRVLRTLSRARARAGRDPRGGPRDGREEANTSG